MIKSGYSINQAISFISNISEQKSKSWIFDIDKKLSDGASFQKAIENYINPSFSFQINMAGHYGHLEESLIQIAEFAQARLVQQAKIKQVLKYPIILIILLTLLFIAVKIFMMPIFASWTVGQVSGSGRFFKSFLILTAISFFLFIFFYLKRFSKESRLNKINLLSRIPVFGKTIGLLVNYELSAQLSMLVSSGLQLSQIAQDVSKQRQNTVEKEFAQAMLISMKKGEGLKGFFNSLPFLDPTIFLYFSQGSEKKLLEKNLKSYSEITYKKLMKNIERLIGLIQPISFGIVGIGILVLYLSMLMPMYQTLGGMN